MQLANKELRKQYGKIDIDKIEVHAPPSSDSRHHDKDEDGVLTVVLGGIERALRHGGSAGTGERNPGDAGPFVRRPG